MKNIALAERPAAFDVDAVRRQFPILARMVHGKPLAYLGQRRLRAARRMR